MDPFVERESERKRILKDTRLAAAKKISKKPLDTDVRFSPSRLYMKLAASVNTLILFFHVYKIILTE